MTYTDNGSMVVYGYDWMPLAMANGIEWMHDRRNNADKFGNLYRRFGLSYTLWYIGAVSQFLYPDIAKCIRKKP